MSPETNNLNRLSLSEGLVLSTRRPAVEKASHKKHARLFASSGESIAGNNILKAIDRSGSQQVLLATIQSALSDLLVSFTHNSVKPVSRRLIVDRFKS
jgi:hypothetical protein